MDDRDRGLVIEDDKDMDNWWVEGKPVTKEEYEIGSTSPPSPVFKATNPKDAVGIRKPPQSTVSQSVMAEVGVGMLEGARKYGRHNYRVVALGVRASVYYDATRRHIDYWWEGADVDPDSGLSHITKAICSLIVLRDAMIQDNWQDDRPPKTPSEHKAYVQTLVDELFERIPESKDAFTEVK